ncbi:MAG: hypothetical protein Q7U04_11285 [Bacteriovorax sp.]|nr:hypothetical protein [Bacteriovorax sp.]
MKIALFLALLFLDLAYAGDKTTAYNLVCKPMSFETDRNNCIFKISKYLYFDNKALGICADINFDSNKISCLEVIGNKVYEGYEMNMCLNETFESKKLECLNRLGSIYSPNRSACVPRDEVIGQLTISLNDLRSGRLQAVGMRLSDLLAIFANCN